MFDLTGISDEKKEAVIGKIQKKGMQTVYNHPMPGHLAVYLPVDRDIDDSAVELIDILESEGVSFGLPRAPSMFGE